MDTKNIFIVYSRTVEGRTADGAVLESRNGCNGAEHASELEKIFYDEDGEVEFAEQVINIKRGPCDGSCGRPGWFYFPDDRRSSSSR